MSLNIPQKVPMLPGYIFNDPLKRNFHKTQQFSVQQNTNVEKTIFLQEEVDPILMNEMRNGASKSMTYGQRERPENDYIPRIQAPWLKYDRQVLRFAAYFQESVVESPVENYRLRKCLIYYYLNDNTIQITEPKNENSGILQGAFLKRHMVPKETGKPKPSVMNNQDIQIEYFNWKDFKLGMNIQFYGRVFRITDCDEFTKLFYQQMNVELQSSEKMPTDNFELLQSVKEMKINPPDTKEYKEYFEVKLGGGHPNDGLAQYLQNDRKVLSFNIYWDDQTLEGQVNYYTLNYYLSDSTIEVKEKAVQNNGKDPYPLLLRRDKVPKKQIFTHYPGMTLQKEQYYMPEDLICGQTINIFSRDCVIYDCDAFTKQWYQSNLNLKQLPVPLKKPQKQQVIHPIPPYNGYGIEEDTMQNVIHLTMKRPKKDFNKMFAYDQIILRFEGRMISENKEENDQKYIINFYCGDDTIQVYKLTSKNSGIQGGMFIQRNRFKNPEDNSQYYRQTDFLLGNVVQLGAYNFQLIRMDEYTNSYMEQQKHIFIESDFQRIINTIKSHSINYSSYDQFLIEIIKAIDRSGYGTITYEELVLGFKKLKINLSYQALYTVMRRFDNGGWKLSVKALFEELKKM